MQEVRQSERSQSDRPCTLTISLHRDENKSQEIARELVTASDLIEARSELWLDTALRRGQPGVDLEAVQAQVVPIPVKGHSCCSGYALESIAADGSLLRKEFTLRSLQPVAARAAQRLQAAGVLKPADLYFYELISTPIAEAVTPNFAEPVTPKEAAPRGFRIDTKPAALNYLTLPLGELQREARPVRVVNDGFSPVFYTAAALEKAEQYARKGAAATEPVETGAVLIGSLCSCPESGEMFVVITDALEAADAEQSKYSLYYSERTWSRIQTIVSAMQQQPATQTQRIVGQAHGHNFLPASGAAPCEACPHLAVCSRTSVFVSEEDLTWSRAVFHRQPWALCQIFGLNARAEPVEGLFGQRDGRLQERGYYVIPKFEFQEGAGRFASLSAPTEKATGYAQKRTS